MGAHSLSKRWCANRIIGLLILGSFANGTYPQVQNVVAACAPLLAGGAFKITLQNGSTKSFKSSKDWFCSDQFTEMASSGASHADLTIPIDDIPVGAAYDANNQQHAAARQRFCSDSTKDFSESQNSFLLKKEGDPVLVNGYLQCIGQFRGSYLEVSESPPFF